ncbi:unnamed protein product [Mytilus coruscus]|uniref:DUF4806 domain-containing protein n=1 Tax=Mytilus coruscus TaxID=42192 RepID=A0A6J8EQV4_MYTCO|nr:unnamed protein product [Mytilus coruscus]
MHQDCFGVMKRLLLIWMLGKKKETKISFGHIEEISTRLVQLSKFIPKKFARKPRGLDEIDYWKATEYRQFLLYTGKLVLKGVLKKELYEHFLSFSVAMTKLAQILYGEEILVNNVHSMVHWADDAKEYGCLDNCAAFSFENHMQHLKKMIRSGKNPLSQIVKRISELDNLQSKKVETVISNICNKKPNNAFVLNNHTCCEVLMLKQYVIVGFSDNSVAVAHKSGLEKQRKGNLHVTGPLTTRVPEQEKGKYLTRKEDSDHEDEPTCTSKKISKLPVPPMLSSPTTNSSFSPLNRSLTGEMTRPSTSSIPSSTSAMRFCTSSSLAALSPEMVRSLTLSPTVDWLPHDTNSSFRPLNRSLTGEMTKSSSSPSTMRSGISRSLPAPSPLMTPSPGMIRSSMTPSPAVDWLPHDTTTQRKILENLAEIPENQREMKEMLGQILSSKSGPKDIIIEDIIQSPAKSEEELLEIIWQIENPEFKKKLISLLSTLGGSKVVDTVRKMLRVFGTNGLWSNYSLKGKKKKNFSELSLCRVVIKSCIKIHRCNGSEFEECIAETLKHAPAQKDGPRYKKRPETNTRPADQRAENHNLE